MVNFVFQAGQWQPLESFEAKKGQQRSVFPPEILTGESIFTTFQLLSAQKRLHIPFWSFHKERLKKGWFYLNRGLQSVTKLDGLWNGHILQLELRAFEAFSSFPESCEGMLGRITLIGLDFDNAVFSIREKENTEAEVELFFEQSPRERAVPSDIKAPYYLREISDIKIAKQMGAQEVLYQNRQNNISECAFNNIFFYKANAIFTSTRECGILEGITRERVITCLKTAARQVHEIKISAIRVSEFDGAFICGSGHDLRWVKKIHGLDFNSKNIENFKECERVYMDHKNNNMQPLGYV